MSCDVLYSGIGIWPLCCAMFVQLLCQVLLAVAALAIPARRSSRPRGPLHPAGTNGAAESLSSNWAGAVLVADTATYTSVSGTFNVPTPKVPVNGTSSSYTGAIWIGIDGDTCGTTILQAGIEFWVDSTGTATYAAWNEWWPNNPSDFSGISFSPGDAVSVTVTASGTTGGTAAIENLTKGQRASQRFSSEIAVLCEYNAEWIVEAYDEGGELLPFPDFSSVTFTDVSAMKAGGLKVDTSGASIEDIARGGTTLTATRASGSTITVDYIAN